jgi:murein DD-endopeptidase MepM/ murein hydrolase activator NlpD
MKKIRFLISIVVIISIFTVSAGASKIDELKNSLDYTEQQRENILNKIKEGEQEKNSVAQEINRLDNEINNINSQINSLSANIEEMNNNITECENNIREIEEKIDLKTELLEKRVRVMYKKGGSLGYVEVLFEAEDLSDFLTRLDMIQKIVDNDVELLSGLEAENNELNMLKAELENEKSQLATALNDVEVKKNEIVTVSRSKEDYMRNLQGKIEELEAQEDRLLAQSKQLESEIQQAQLEMEYAGGVMAWPSPGFYRVTSPYGMRLHPIYGYSKMHTGVDIGVSMNQNIVAANDGVVQYAGWYGAYGNIVIVDHGGGISTLSAHNTSVLVSKGQKVTKGQVISKSGTTGLSTGPHLHFEVRLNGKHTNPMEYIK